jgi:hypothetical protein
MFDPWNTKNRGKLTASTSAVRISLIWTAQNGIAQQRHGV